MMVTVNAKGQTRGSSRAVGVCAGTLRSRKPLQDQTTTDV